MDSTERKRRWRAYSMVQNAIKTGKLIPEICGVCGAKAEAHHEDYDKPLEVVWLCRPHHRLVDTEFRRIGRRNQRVYMPKTKGGKPLIIEDI